MYVDEKVTIWNRIHIDDRDISKEEVIKIISKDGTNGLWEVDLDPQIESVSETETVLYPEDNNGFSTLELYNDEDEIIWENGKGNLNGVE